MKIMESQNNQKISLLRFIFVVLAWLGIIFAVFFLSGCSPSNRMYRILKNNPELAKTTYTKISDTTIVTIPRVYYDTVVAMNYRDTLIVKEKNLTIKSYFNYIDTTHYLSGECDTVTDTIIKTVTVPVQDISIQNKGLFWEMLDILVIIFCAALVVYSLLKRKK